MGRGQVFEGIVESVAFPNRGIVRFGEGKTAIVKNVLPGQRVSFRVRKSGKGRAEGTLLEVLEKSPLELDNPPCAHFGECGGCAFLNLSYEEQLRQKEGQVRDLLGPFFIRQEEGGGPGLAEAFEGILASPRQFGYRNKMEFTFGDSFKGGPLALGMHKRGSFHDIVTVTGCRIADQDFSAILEAALGYFKGRGNVPYYHRMRHEGYLRHLLVRKAARTGEILVSLVTTTQVGAEEEGRLLSGFADALMGLDLEGEIVGILHTRNDSPGDAVIDQGTEILRGRDFIHEEILGMRFLITPFSFFQTNSLGAEVLYEKAREYVGGAGDGKVVYDLYSGTGTIAQVLSPVAGKVIGVEIVPEAVLAARENAAQNGITNCDFLEGDVQKVLDSIGDMPDFIVLDPPREGIHPKALQKIISYGVDKMLYISCKPTSLARDLETLREGGYQATRACCVDMFPASANVETVCLLNKHANSGVHLPLV